MRLSRYLEQADAVHREAWWVVAAERKVPGKTVFGKVQHALARELKLKVSNKSLFSCDRYLVKREILSASGLPQKGEVFESCRSREAALHIADFEMKNSTEADITFQGQNLGELIGLGTAILNRNFHCHLKGDEEGKLTDLICDDFSQDRNATESVRFKVYEYHRGGQNLLKLRGQIYEALYATKKIQADVPLEGKIEVVETQTQAPAPEVPALKPAPVPIAMPKAKQVTPVDPDSQRRKQIEQNGQEYNVEEMGAPPAPGVRAGSRAHEIADPNAQQIDPNAATGAASGEQPPEAGVQDPSQQVPAPGAVAAPPVEGALISTPAEEIERQEQERESKQLPPVVPPPLAPSAR